MVGLTAALRKFAGLPPVTINMTDLNQDLEKVATRVLAPDSP